ncbi:hypothetical protein E0M25_20235 [Bacillus mycoides]|uniref:Uncharacterized protein n=1 Tax=Bacillus cereus TaxID=1396 RepID=A0A1S9U476_BACCE|nr:hypothetical protein BW892_28035 [Bacillus cereus]QWG36410.1 hypothetical protein EXW30_12250 [Bacillus mycoides]QWG47787.1 hypothetical protein EXW31_12515 [Bacillus mycoides]QWH14931.1 hypothetical protein EXW38_12570 [Bacillus mycoides]TBX74039.1 hypothetical protein E0M25_20235 [Bacillus mycoides]
MRKRLSYQCVSIFNRGTLVLFFINVEQMYYLDCLLSVILENMKVRIILKNTRVLKIGMCVGILSVSAPKRVG